MRSWSASLDLLDAIVFFGMRGATPIRIFQRSRRDCSGRAAFQGGIATAILGVAIHFFIAAAIVVTFYSLAAGCRWLVHHAVIAGMLYGAGVYGVMNYIVVPLSAAGHGPFVLVVFLNGLLIHIFGVGIPAAFFAGLRNQECAMSDGLTARRVVAAKHHPLGGLDFHAPFSSQLMC